MLTPPAASEALRAAALAPDLRFVRERFLPDRLVAWLLDPKAIKPDTRMPNFDLAREEAADIAAYLLEATLAPESLAPFARLPLLSRHVSFEEANRQVFSRTCHHCHTDAQSAGAMEDPATPLGLPPLSAEAIQLVESWVAQGTPL